jgi:hypothetical protein
MEEQSRVPQFRHLSPRFRTVVETFALNIEQFRSGKWPLKRIEGLVGRGEFAESRRQRWLRLARRARAGEIRRVQNLADLAQFTWWELYAQLGFGRKALKEVTEILSSVGMELRR